MKIQLSAAVFACLMAGQSFAQNANPLMDALSSRYKAIRQNLLDTAEVMPEAEYQFKLTPAQRPFSEWIGHTAMANYNFCSVVKGQTAPDTKYLHELKGKGELGKAILASFAFCDAAFQAMDDKKAVTPVTIAGKPRYPVDSMVGLIATLNSHYGNLVGYMRTKGIVPPSTARTQKKK